MGEYMRMLNTVKEHIYSKQIESAKNELQKLLNIINSDMKATSNPTEKATAKGGILTLLPVLDDLKMGQVTDTVKRVLALDEARLNPQAKVETPEFDDFFKGFEMPKEEKNGEASIDVQAEDIIIGGLDTPAEEAKPAQNEAPKAEEKPAPAPKKKIAQNRKPLTPLYLDDYIGQEQAKKSIKVAIRAAKKEERVLEHLLICSSYGLGKTTLANIIANEMEMPFFSVNATNLKDTKSLSLYFSKIQESCIIFIDEIHSLKNDVQTVLLSILTDFQVSFIDTEGNESTYPLPPFTLIGATTQAGELLKPFLNRFSILELVDYTEEEKEVIVKSKFSKLGYEITDDAIKSVAKRSRGIPRTIENYAKGIRDLAINYEVKNVDLGLVKEYFDLNNIDELGLAKNDLKILNILADAKSPLALITLESKTGIQREDLEYRYEPYLIKLGLIDKTDRGRVITEKGFKYIRPDEGEK